MRILKLIKNVFNPKYIEKQKPVVPQCPIIYDRNNVTAEEFREYVHWLAVNNINKTIYEPDRFITEAEREVLHRKKSELEEYRKFVRYLAKNNINRTFLC